MKWPSLTKLGTARLRQHPFRARDFVRADTFSTLTPHHWDYVRNLGRPVRQSNSPKVCVHKLPFMQLDLKIIAALHARFAALRF